MTVILIILAAKSEKGWMLHANGLGSLLEWRGPWQQKPYVGTGLSLDHRIMLVAKSIFSCQSTFLRDPIWKTVPWEDDPASKSAADYLVDIGTDIAEYFARIKIYDDSKNDNTLRYSQIKAQVATSLGELNIWWHRWEPERAQSAMEVTSNHATSRPLFPTLLEFDTIWTAYTVSLYDTMRILLLQLWHRLRLAPDLTLITNQSIVLDMPNGTALLGISSDIKGLACEILRTLTYCYGQSRRIVCTSSFLFIQDVAHGCFDPGSREALWIAEHGWAESAKFPDIEDENLLKRFVAPGLNGGWGG